LSLRQLGTQWYIGSLQVGDDPAREYELRGDEWQLDARVLRWKLPGQLAGLRPVYRLERLSGRYGDPKQDLAGQRSVHDLREGWETWEVRQRLLAALPWADARWRSGAYLPMLDGATYSIHLSPTGGPVATPADARTEALLREAGWQLLRQAQLLQHEGVFLGTLAVTLEAAGLAAVAGLHVDAEQQRVVVGLAVTQARHPLGRLEVLHLAVPQAGGHQHRRIVLALDVVVGRVVQHVLVVDRVGRIAPLVVLVVGQRDALVHHRRHHVHEGHVGDDGPVLLRRHVDHRAHQQAAGAAAHGRHPVGSRVTLGHQEIGDVDEVGEGVDLLQQLAVLIPLPAHLLAAADVGDGVDGAAVHQADHVAVERGRGAGAVGTVGVLVQGGGTVAAEVLAVQDRHRNAGAVAGGGPDPLGHVLRLVVAGHRLL